MAAAKGGDFCIVKMLWDTHRPGGDVEDQEAWRLLSALAVVYSMLSEDPTHLMLQVYIMTLKLP